MPSNIVSLLSGFSEVGGVDCPSDPRCAAECTELNIGWPLAGAYLPFAAPVLRVA